MPSGPQATLQSAAAAGPAAPGSRRAATSAGTAGRSPAPEIAAIVCRDLGVPLNPEGPLRLPI